MGQVIPMQRSYAAARVSRSNGWIPVDPGVNELIRMSSRPVRARIRQLVRDFPYFSRAVRLLADYVVGTGHVYQARILNRDGVLNDIHCSVAEDGWRRFGDEADFSGRLHLEEMSRMAKRQDSECGEFLLIRRHDDNPRRYVPLALQMIEPDWLTGHGVAGVPRTNRVDQGVEIETATGRVQALHIEDPDSWGKPMRVPAEQVLHGFESVRPGQLRGISDFAPGVLVTEDLKDVMEGEVDAARYASKWLALITRDPFQHLSNQPGDPNDTTDKGNRIEYLENSIIEYLRPGEKVEFPSNNRPSANFPPFVRLILCMFSVTAGLPLELLSGDYQGLNWAITKVVRADFAFSLRPVQQRHSRQFYQPLQRAFMDAAVLAGRLPFRDYFTNPYPYLRANWYPPVMPAVDKLRDTKAALDTLSANLESPQSVVAELTGRDYEDVIKDIAKAKEIRAKYGVLDKEVSTALANNPAAVEEQE